MLEMLIRNPSGTQMMIASKKLECWFGIKKHLGIWRVMSQNVRAGRLNNGWSYKEKGS